MIKISELKEGNTLVSNLHGTFTILKHLGNCLLLESEDCIVIYSERMINKYGLGVLVPTPEKKYFMGFEVREYPERPIVEVTHTDGGFKFLRRLAEVKEDCVICEKEHGAPTTRWDYIYRIPETKINE